MGGLGGAAIAKAGFAALHPQRLGQADPLHLPVAAPRNGAGLVLTVGLSWLLGAPPGPLDRVSAGSSSLSAALYSLSHGANDAQKTMGIIVGLLVSTQALFVDQPGWLHHLHVPTADRIPSGSRWRPTPPSDWGRRWAGGES